ncbi:hypothetical protein NHX12_018385 [Muraenolepis orangiensis]|uniref:TIR domain-containing protein n=1 Tax=Muraenolepis orangiensis TaxID=630683 RepID=A0A9Q0IXZ1_9TELE|nr:hypothetical protein NHX12_018385 [Muraenolepis orangiensis]
MPLPNRPCILCWLTAICYLTTMNRGSAASIQKKTSCSVRHDSADCSHMSLNDIPQNLPGNITHLDMSHNRLICLPGASFALYSGLLHLDVGFNSLTKLDETLCLTLVRLQMLNLERNEVHVLQEKDLSHCVHLKVLNMASNRLKLKAKEGNPFASLENLTTLDVSKNMLVSAMLGTRPQLPSLVALTLSHNAISALKQDDFLFLSLSTSLRVLNLSNLPLKKFENGCFKLRTLTLAKSLTGTLDLDPSPFGPLTNLNILDLSNNNIANINAGMLKGLVNLMVLKMQHNNLARVWKSANIGGPVLFLKDLGSLTVLNMDYNGLDEIPVDALMGLKKLKELSFNGNVLNSLRDSVFQDLLSLQELHLQKNLITAVRPQVFKPAMENLSLLDMGRNPFDCTCESILWFVTWLNATNTSVMGSKDQFTCNTPLAYFNLTVMDFDSLSCKDSTPFQALYILSSTIVIAVMLVALLVRFHGWRIQFYWNVLINRTLGFSDVKVEEGREFEYDAYVIHAEEDDKWVKRSLLPLEKEKYVFFKESRDFVPGTSLLNAIVDNMKKSRKFLFVVSESLLNDSWCRRFKAHQALHQVIEDSRDSVILVFLQDVHDYRLSQALFLRRGMLQPRCLLYWPVHQERVPAFRHKLRIALGMTNTQKL